MHERGNTCIGKKDERPKAIKDADPTAVLEADIKRQEALILRRAGRTFDEIGETLGVSGKTACQYVNDAWERIHDDTDEERRVLRAIEEDRIDAAVRVCMAIITTADLIVVTTDQKGHEIRLEAGDLRLKAIDRLAKCVIIRSQLRGLFAPAKIEVKNTGRQDCPTLEELRASVARSKANRAAATGQAGKN